MSFKDARMKIATFLLSLVSSEAPPDNGPVTLRLPLSRQEIGEVLELSPETISRTLTTFRHEQLLTARGRQVTLQNLLELEAIARG
jgi:CRP/FNR family transcriptional regulator, anaerobic regulatory protein